MYSNNQEGDAATGCAMSSDRGQGEEGAEAFAREVEMLDRRLPDRLIVRRSPRPERRPAVLDRET